MVARVPGLRLRYWLYVWCSVGFGRLCARVSKVLNLLYHIIVIVMDRLAYLTRSLLTKAITQTMAVAYVHYKVFYDSPLKTSTLARAIHAEKLTRSCSPWHAVLSQALCCCCCSASPGPHALCLHLGLAGIPTLDNKPLVAFYVFYFAYFVIGAAQIFYGYDRSPPKDSLKQFKGVYPVLFKYVFVTYYCSVHCSGALSLFGMVRWCVTMDCSCLGAHHAHLI